MDGLAGELIEEPLVVFDKVANIRNSPLHHRKTVEPHSEGEACDLIWIKSAVPPGFVYGVEDCWIHHSAPSHFQPFGLFACCLELDVDFEAELGERKEMRAKTKFRIRAEHATEESLKRAL